MITKNPLYLITKLALLELARYKNITLFLVLNLTLGLFGFFLLQIFQQSLTLQSAEKAQIILGGDLSISARRSFSEAEIKAWESQFQFLKKSQFISLFSMMRTEQDSKLVNVAVFDDHYPLYGQFVFSGAQGLASDRAYVWVDPEVQEMLNLKINDSVAIGESNFIFAGNIVQDPSRLFRGTSFAPRVLVHNKYLPATGLMKPGSTFSEYWYYQTEPNIDAAAIKTKLEKFITDSFVKISTSQDEAEDSSRVLNYFTDYLGLVALVALGLCFLCSSYLLQWSFISKKKTIAIYKTLGMSDKKIIFIYVLQNFVISLLACVLAFVLVQSCIPLLQQLLTQKFDLPINLTLSTQALIATGLIALLGPMLIVVPQIIQIINLRPLMLLQNVLVIDFRRTTLYFAWLAASIILFWVLASWQSHSYKIASIFTLSMIALIIFFQVINRFGLYFLEKLSENFNWRTRYAIKGLSRKTASAGLVFTTMSLATLVLSLLPHVKSSIINEVRPEQSSQMPSLFMFDIQPEQIDSLQQLAKNIFNQELIFSPLVRSRILKINDKNYERVVQTNEIQTREADEEARFRNRGINLTYRSYLQESEREIDGKFDGVFNKNQLAQISIEKRYAARMGIKMGKQMTFDVQGVEVEAQGGAFRHVRWTSFQPNFFILFPLGVLEDAPQIFLTSVFNSQQSLIKDFQKQASSEFKNVSIIDVRRTVENSLKYIEQMSLGLQFMAWLAVLVGIFVFLVLINTQLKERIPEMNLLQILGLSNQQVSMILLFQFLLLIIVSVTFGVLLGLALAWVLITFFFEIKTAFDMYYLLLLGSLLLPMCGLAIYTGLKPLKKLNPMDLIRQS